MHSPTLTAPKHSLRRIGVIVAIGILGAAAIGVQAHAFSLSSIESSLEGSLGSGAENQINGAEDSAIGGIGSKLDGFGSHLPTIGNYNLSNIFESLVGKYVGLAENYLNNWTDKILGGMLKGIEGNNTGSMGAPDPAQTSSDIGNTIGNDGKGNSSGVAATEAQKQDVFNQNPVTIQQSLTHATTEDNARASSETFLGKDGQELLKSELKSEQTDLQNIQQLASDSQGRDVTQDVMKDLTAMTGDQSQLEADSDSQLIQLNQQQAEANNVNANVSESLDELNRSRHAEAMSGAYDVMRGAANLYLP